jgi:hypothetical protein
MGDSLSIRIRNPDAVYVIQFSEMLNASVSHFSLGSEHSQIVMVHILVIQGSRIFLLVSIPGPGLMQKPDDALVDNSQKYSNFEHSHHIFR